MPPHARPRRHAPSTEPTRHPAPAGGSAADPRRRTCLLSLGCLAVGYAHRDQAGFGRPTLLSARSRSARRCCCMPLAGPQRARDAGATTWAAGLVQPAAPAQPGRGPSATIARRPSLALCSLATQRQHLYLCCARPESGSGARVQLDFLTGGPPSPPHHWAPASRPRGRQAAYCSITSAPLDRELEAVGGERAFGDLRRSRERWPKLSTISSGARSLPLKPIRTDWNAPSLALGLASAHSRPSFGAANWRARSPCRASRRPAAPPASRRAPGRSAAS